MSYVHLASGIRPRSEEWIMKSISFFEICTALPFYLSRPEKADNMQVSRVASTCNYVVRTKLRLILRFNDSRVSWSLVAKRSFKKFLSVVGKRGFLTQPHRPPVSDRLRPPQGHVGQASRVYWHLVRPGANICLVTVFGVLCNGQNKRLVDTRCISFESIANTGIYIIQ